MRNNSPATSFATIRGVKSQDVKKSYNKLSNIFTLTIKNHPQTSYTTHQSSPSNEPVSFSFVTRLSRAPRQKK